LIIDDSLTSSDRPTSLSMYAQSVRSQNIGQATSLNGLFPSSDTFGLSPAGETPYGAGLPDSSEVPHGAGSPESDEGRI
jgi:hypothetical protein